MLRFRAEEDSNLKAPDCIEKEVVGSGHQTQEL